jgi:PmbA protein
MFEFQTLAKNCAQESDGEHELYSETKRKKNLEWDGSTIKSVRTDRDAGAGFRVSEDDRIGLAYANASVMEPDWLVEQAEANRRLLPVDEHQSLSFATPSGSIGERWFDASLQDNIADRRDRITASISSLLDEKEGLKNLQVEYEEQEHQFELYRNGQLIAGERRSSFSISSWAVCESDSDVQSGFQQQTCYQYDSLSIDDVLRESVEHGLNKLGAEPPESRTGPILLKPRAASGLLRLVRSMLDGESVARGRSAWGPETIGNTVAKESITIKDDPSLEAGASNRQYDAEGYPLEPINLIDNGTCQGFLTNQYVSDRLELDNNHRATRNFTSRPNVTSTNFCLEKGNNSHAELEESLGSGPVVTSIQPGSGIDSVAGQFSVGASGYMIKSGRKASPFDEATISGDVEDLLKGVDSIGNNPPKGYSIASPSLLLEELSLGGSD